MDFYVITPRATELVLQVVDGQLVIVPAPDASSPAAAPDPPAPGT